MNAITLSESEKKALRLLAREISLLVTSVPDKNEKDVFGDITPGVGVYRKLIKKGLVFETEEDIMEDGFQFTPSYELTEAGEKLAKTLC